jgi:hypothetical protein
MRHTFRLPSESTLKSYISGFAVTTGFDSDYMLALQKRAQSLSDNEKCVVLTFDGMSLRSSLKYLEYDDRIVGFEDLGSFSGRSNDAAKHALQFMIRGISTKWKQPVGHFFTGNSISPKILKAMLETIVMKVEGFGLEVKAVVCDQEASHRCCLTTLGVTTDEPFFKSSSGSEVYCMHDPPHLIKNVRNNLLTNDILIDNKVVSFDHIVKLFEMEQDSVLRFVPKLTKAHVELNNFKKMNVKLATQVLSRSVACGIRTYISMKKMPVEAEDTAEFIERIDRLFDIMNSNSRNSKSKWKNPLCLKSVEQLHVLESDVKWIAEWKFRCKKKKTVKENLPCKQGLMMTVNALRLVCLDLLTKHNFGYVFTSRFNQDIVENWFSCIRGKGRNNDSRSTLEYEAASKNIAVNWLLERPEKGSNCELDCDSFVGLVSKTFEGDARRVGTSESLGNESHSGEISSTVDQRNEEITEVFQLTSDWLQTYRLSCVDHNVVSYMAGYITGKINNKLNCDQCQSAYVVSKETWNKVDCDHNLLIRMRNYSWAKYGLTTPSPQVLELCCSMERIFQTNMEGLMAGSGVMARLTEMIKNTIFLDSYYVDACCKMHQTYWITTAVTIFLRIRIHHFVRVRNREIKAMAEKKKQKLRNTLSEGKKAVKSSRKLRKIKHV